MRVLHVLRAPAGGLFRHVHDLTLGLRDRGALVGIICRDERSDAVSEGRLLRLEAACALGLHRIPMARAPGLGDIGTALEVRRTVRELEADIVHGHGAKGGLYARLASRRPDRAVVYTPHGGSLHYSPRSPAGAVFQIAERFLLPRTDGFIFESRFARDGFKHRIPAVSARAKVIHNGLAAAEFETVPPVEDAADFLFLGELRALKGIDELLSALTVIAAERPVTCAVVGSGPAEARFRAAVGKRGLGDAVRFYPPMPARRAFALGRCLVFPSRKESLPYVVLEALAAGLPVIATNTGGVPEIFGSATETLLRPGDEKSLAAAMSAHLASPAEKAALCATVRERLSREFSLDDMVGSVFELYQTLLQKSYVPAGNPRAGAEAL